MKDDTKSLRYHVSFHYSSPAKSGFGESIVSLPSLRTLDDLKSVRGIIEKNINASIVILSFSLMGVRENEGNGSVQESEGSEGEASTETLGNAESAAPEDSASVVEEASDRILGSSPWTKFLKRSLIYLATATIGGVLGVAADFLFLSCLSDREPAGSTVKGAYFALFLISSPAAFLAGLLALASFVNE